MKDEDEFLKWSSRVWNYNLSLIESYKSLLSHKNRAVLLDLSLKIQAYDFGIHMQARTDFRDDWFSRYAKEGYIDESDEKEVITKVNNSFQSSFDNKRSEKIRDLVREAELMHTPSEVEPLPNQGKEPPLQKKVSLYGDFTQAYLPSFFGSHRQDIAKNLKEELKLPDNVVSQIQRFAFDEVVSLANERCNSDSQPKNITSLIQFLERSIEMYFPLFLKDLAWNGRIVSLSKLRKSNKQPFNTACYRCGKQLLKRDNKHYCTKRENRACYEARLKESRQSGFQKVILRTKNKCDKCKRMCSLNFIHKLDGQEMQFCSDKCWEAFRKTYYRKKKLASAPNNLSQKTVAI